MNHIITLDRAIFFIQWAKWVWCGWVEYNLIIFQHIQRKQSNSTFVYVTTKKHVFWYDFCLISINTKKKICKKAPIHQFPWQHLITHINHLTTMEQWNILLTFNNTSFSDRRFSYFFFTFISFVVPTAQCTFDFSFIQKKDWLTSILRRWKWLFRLILTAYLGQKVSKLNKIPKK